MTNQSNVNVKDYGVKGDGYTDDTSAIQKVFDDNNASVIYFPAGVYNVTRPIIVSCKTKIYGDGLKGSKAGGYQVGTIIKNSSNSNYIFKLVDSKEYCPLSIEHIGFYGTNILDARSEDLNAHQCHISNCGFVAESNGGVAIMMYKADFWTIEKSKFYGGFYTMIRCAGHLTAPLNSTQVNVTECSFINDGSYQTACVISYELANSCTVRNSDFACNAKADIDIGGKIYHDNLPKSSDMYARGASNRSSNLGRCSSITVDTCHFENVMTAVYVDGGSNGNEITQGINIVNCDILSVKSNAICIRAENSVFGLNTNMNRMFLRDTSYYPMVATGIKLGGWCHNAFCFMDYIVGEKGKVVEKVNGGLNNIVWQRFENACKVNDIGWNCPKVFVRQLEYQNYKQVGEPTY